MFASARLVGMSDRHAIKVQCNAVLMSWALVDYCIYIVDSNIEIVSASIFYFY